MQAPLDFKEEDRFGEPFTLSWLLPGSSIYRHLRHSKIEEEREERFYRERIEKVNDFLSIKHQRDRKDNFFGKVRDLGWGLSEDMVKISVYTMLLNDVVSYFSQ